jgi:hypothetical protein
MSILSGPLFSISGKGKLKNIITYRERYGKSYSYKFYYPGSKKYFIPSTEQIQNRKTYRSAVAAWNSLSENEKNIYRKRSKGKNYSGYNLFVKEYLVSPPPPKIFSIYGNKIYGTYKYGDH